MTTAAVVLLLAMAGPACEQKTASAPRPPRPPVAATIPPPAAPAGAPALAKPASARAAAATASVKPTAAKAPAAADDAGAELKRQIAQACRAVATAAPEQWEAVARDLDDADRQAGESRLPQAERSALREAVDAAGRELSRRLAEPFEPLEWTSADRRLWRTLARPVTFDFDGATLEEARGFIAELTGENVVFDPAALKQLGIDPSQQQVHLRVRQVALRRAVELLLEPLEMMLVVQDGLLSITDRMAAGDMLVCRSYPVGPLATIALPGMPAIDCSNHLAENLRSVVSPDGWDVHGGRWSQRFDPAGQLLMVTAPSHVQDEVLSHLATLHRGRRRQLADCLKGGEQQVRQFHELLQQSAKNREAAGLHQTIVGLTLRLDELEKSLAKRPADAKPKAGPTTRP